MTKGVLFLSQKWGFKLLKLPIKYQSSVQACNNCSILKLFYWVPCSTLSFLFRFGLSKVKTNVCFFFCRSGLKRGVYVYLECENNTNCNSYTLELTTNCQSRKPFVIQCLSDESDSLERLQTCHLLHSKVKLI